MNVIRNWTAFAPVKTRDWCLMHSIRWLTAFEIHAENMQNPNLQRRSDVTGALSLSLFSLSPSMHVAPSQVSVTSMVPQTRDSRKRNGCFASRWRKLPFSTSHQRKKAIKKKESYIGFCKPDIQYWRMRRCRTTEHSIDNKEARKHTWRSQLSIRQKAIRIKL